jgi:ribonuclease D
MEEYARNDTRFLKPLADILRDQLKEKGRLKWHEEACQRLIDECSIIRTPDPDAVWRIKGSYHLAPDAMAVVRELWHWREKEAIGANKPPYFILQPEQMIAIAVAAAENKPVQPLIPARFSVRRMAALLKSVQHGLDAKEKPQPLRTTHYRQSAEEKRRYHDLEKRRNRRASELGLDPTLIASRATLVQLARNGDAEPDELMSWQAELLKPA